VRAYLVKKYKRPMQADDAPEPTVRDQNVLVDVRAAGVNLLDAKVRDGEFNLILPYKAPFVLGHDLAGVVSVSAWFDAVAITPGVAARVKWI